MKLPAPGFALATRSMESVAEPEPKLDFAGLIFQSPSSEVAARPAIGSAVARSRAPKVRRTVVVEANCDIGTSVWFEWASLGTVSRVLSALRCSTVAILRGGREA